MGAPYTIAPPARPYLDDVAIDPPRLKIAFTVSSPLKADVHPECVKAVQNAARLLEGLGHIVSEAAPDIDGEALGRSYIMMYFGEIAADIDELQTVLGRPLHPRDVEPATWALNLLGRSFSAADFVTALRRWNTFSRQMATFHETYDFYLTPTIATLPPRIGELAQSPRQERLLNIINALGLGGLLKASGIPEMLAPAACPKCLSPNWPISPDNPPCLCRFTGAPKGYPAACSSSAGLVKSH